MSDKLQCSHWQDQTLCHEMCFYLSNDSVNESTSMAKKKNYWAALSCGVGYCAVQGGSNVWICKWNRKVWPFKLMKATEQYYCAVYYTVQGGPNVECVDGILKRDHSNERYWAIRSRDVLFIMPCKVLLSLESVIETLKCDHSNNSYCLSSTSQWYCIWCCTRRFWVCECVIEVLKWDCRATEQQKLCTFSVFGLMHLMKWGLAAVILSIRIPKDVLVDRKHFKVC